MSMTPLRRKNMRLVGHNYREPGMYFVTPCTHRREARFGQIVDGVMQPNEAGCMVMSTWQNLPRTFPGASLDAWILMPNHFHGLLLFDAENIESNPALGDAMKWFKAITTTRYIRGVQDQGWPRFAQHLWQRNYYDHIVRNDADLDRIRSYIEHNPANWMMDSLYTA